MEKERIIELPKVVDRRGNLSFIEVGCHIPFHIARAYWIYDIPGGQSRGSHAFRSQHEIIIALSGSFDVLLDDGKTKRQYTLNRSYIALYVPNMMWRSLDNFSTNALCLVVASEPYDENDYIRNYRLFRKSLNTRQFPPLGDMPSDLDKEVHPQYNTIDDCTIMEFPVIKNRAGNIVPVHGADTIHFDIKRVFYIYDIPSGKKRGMHAHKHCHEVLIAAAGSFKVELDDGTNKKTVLLNNPGNGLYIPPGVWATEKDYSSGAVCLVLASEKYDTKDYISKYSEFKTYRQSEN